MDRKGIMMIAAAVLFVVVWNGYVVPTYFPVEPPKEPAPAAPDAGKAPGTAETPAPGGTPATGDTTAPDATPDAAPDAAPDATTPDAAPDATTPDAAPDATTPDAAPDAGEPPKESPPAPLPGATALEPGVPDSPEEIEEVTIGNDTCAFTFTSRGGALKNVRLKDFTEEDRETELTLIRPFDEDLLPLGLRLLDTQTDLRRSNYRTTATDTSAAFVLALPTGLTIEKRVSLTDGAYDFKLELTFSNTSNAPRTFTPQMEGPGSIIREDKMQNFLTGKMHYTKNDSHDTADTNYRKAWHYPKNLFSDEVPTSDISLVYLAAGNRFFGSALVSEEPLLVRGMGTVPLSITRPVPPDAPPGTAAATDESITSFVVFDRITLEPGESRSFTFTFFTGPKKADILAEYGSLSELLDYGWFGAVSRFLLWILRFFYVITRNYGVAIILMTVMVKIVLFPLARKGAVSQRKQQALAPKLKQLQAKYKNNKQKLNQEMMKMYREEGISPLSGCLPMLMQLPVFIGLLRLLQYSIEIRQACFIPGWIDDLSKPDTIASLPLWIPVVSGQLNLLPIIMGAASIIHQKMMPKPADPQQQQQMMMLKFMPLIFVLLLYTWASGLLLYWTVSTILGIAEQHILRKTFDSSE